MVGCGEKVLQTKKNYGSVGGWRGDTTCHGGRRVDGKPRDRECEQMCRDSWHIDRCGLSDFHVILTIGASSLLAMSLEVRPPH